jgi:hypothetical protein
VQAGARLSGVVGAGGRLGAIQGVAGVHPVSFTGAITLDRLKGGASDAPPSPPPAAPKFTPFGPPATTGPPTPVPAPMSPPPAGGTQPTREGGPAIGRIFISDTADTNGYVSFEKPSISRTAPKIFVTVQVLGARKGTVVSVSVTYLGNNVSLPPLTGEITIDGNVLKAFSFTNVAKEWPAGLFRVRVALPDGTERTKEFRIE